MWTASAALHLARLEQAADADREGARRAAKQACRGLLKNSKLDKGGFAPGYRLQGTYEWLLGRPRKAEKCWHKSLAVAEELGARYQEAQTRLEIGRRLGDRVELERAEALFAEMGAALDLADARGLLGKGESRADLVVAPEGEALPPGQPVPDAAGVEGVAAPGGQPP